MIDSNPNTPTFMFDDSRFHWQMTRCEKFAFASLLEVAKPDVAIEIGTYKGGSLNLIAKHARKVYSIDVSPECRESLSRHFSNVEFHTGSSVQLIPAVLESIKNNSEKLGFVLIDGDHSTPGVKADIEAILEYIPQAPVYIIFHDSFNPPARQGILSADWQKSEYVHYVEVDFIPGVYHFHAFDTAPPHSMYGGLAVAMMLPDKRKGELVIHQSQRGLFETVLPHSCHTPETWSDKLLKKLGLCKAVQTFS